jgi:hypothetical protein
MRSLNELTVRGPAPQLARLREQVDRSLTGGWRRGTETEARLQEMGIRGGTTYCYACSATDRRPVAALWLQARGSEELYVSNIVPQGKRELTDDEYNLILADFESNVLQPASEGLAVEITLVHHRVSLDVYLSPEAVRRLEAFSAVADKGNLHPKDCQRWREFVIQAHLERAGLDPALLEQWLADQGWPEGQRQHLVCEYESARSVLTAYDEERLEKCLP